ncbi:MAG TPA: OmpA family protein [Polyangiales bacterium]
MPTVRVLLRDLGKSLNFASGASYTVVVRTLTADVVEMEDIHFHHDSAVVLPWRYGENTDAAPEQERMAGLSVIAAALRYAKDNAGKKLLLAGHADSSGGADYNRSLSEARAKATQALLQGDRAGWGGVCAAHDKVEDLQRVLAWLAEAHGWPCHPGEVDDKLGPHTRDARRAFRKRHNEEFSGNLALDAETSAEDWSALFDLYELSLRDELGDAVDSARAALTFHEPALLACGEDFAAGGNRPTGIRSASDRRVDLLFLDPGEPYPDFFGETPPGNSIYGPAPEVRRQYLPVPPPVQLSLRLSAIEGLYKPGFVMPGDAEPKGAGYKLGYLSEDDKGRVFLNHKPRVDAGQSWQDVVAKDVQFIELCASVTEVQGTMPPDARVEWEWFDPNDPSRPEANAHDARLPDEIDVDGRAQSQRNRGTCDHPSPGGSDMARFAQAGDFGFAEGASVQLCDTDIKQGVSRVRLHVSNVAGDNFVVLARIKNSPRITPSGTCKTGVMTVWKRIDVEYVRMAGAHALPISKVPPFFEPARVQMDFGPEREVPSKPFLTALDRDEESACSDYASKSRGEFTFDGKPGWFFLAAAERASSEFFSAPPAGSGAPAPTLSYAGKAKVEVVIGSDENWEKLIVDQEISGRVALLKVHDRDGGPHAFMGVWKKEVIAGTTHLHINGLDYQSDFVVPSGDATGLIGEVGKGGAYDKTDTYYLRHRMRQPAGTWEPGGFGFPEEVYIRGRPPGGVETSGLSPSAIHRSKEYFAGRLLIFTRAFGATSLDEDDAVGTIVHEFTHAFSYPHKCGFYSFQMPAKFSCSMNYFSTWLYASGTRNVQRFVFGESGAHLCAKHLAGVREVHLEDNPAMWKW